MNTVIDKSLNYIFKRLDLFLKNPVSISTDNQLKAFIELVYFVNNFIPDSQRFEYSFEVITEFLDHKLADSELYDKFKNNIDLIQGTAILEQYLQKRGESLFLDNLEEIVFLSQNFSERIYKTPYRVMDTKYSLNKIGIKAPLNSYEEILKDTILGKRMPLFYYNPDAMYSLTHTIFYLTDMGRNSVESYNINDLDYILKNLILERILSKDLDVLAELVLCAIFLRKYDAMSEIIDYSISFIVKNQNKNGSFSGPMPLIKYSKELEFKNNYHTTLVCIGALLWYIEVKK